MGLLWSIGTNVSGAGDLPPMIGPVWLIPIRFELEFNKTLRYMRSRE